MTLVISILFCSMVQGDVTNPSQWCIVKCTCFVWNVGKRETVCVVWYSNFMARVRFS